MDRRCLQNTLRLNSSSIGLVKRLAHSSKNIFNTGVFGYKKMMELHTLQLDYYCVHLNEYLNMFSPSDRICIGKRLCFRKEIDEIIGSFIKCF